MQNPNVSQIPRCLHGVYAPHGVPNPCCTVCCPVEVSSHDKAPVIRFGRKGWSSEIAGTVEIVGTDETEENQDSQGSQEAL